MPHNGHATEDAAFEDAARTALATVFARPRHEWELDERTLLDTLACIAHAHQEPLIVRESRLRGLPRTLVLNGAVDGVGVRDAAFVNAAFAHGQDFDDTQLSTTAHVSSVVWAALLAAAPPEADGARLAEASAAGRRFLRMLSPFVVPRHLRAGWHATGTTASLAAVVALGVLLSDEATTWRAVGIAGSLIGGLRANNMTSLKALHAGRAAENAVWAVDLARQPGWAGTPSVAALGRGMGFADTGRLLPDAREDADVLAKKYPTCSGTHPAIELALAERDRLAAADAIELTVPPLVAEETTNAWPDSLPQARMGLAFTVALALAAGRVDDVALRTGLGDRAVRSVFDRIAVRIEPDEPEPARYEPWARIESARVGREQGLVAPTDADIRRKWQAAGDRPAPTPLKSMATLGQALGELPC
ncbi:MmgE/PrpD family protein [Streptomyces solisilvae]|uniref:MmgE/PrpD family protein n=1 Tax=Streptomyces malaysiensis TaxID=92644 RepID=UPI0033218F46